MSRLTPLARVVRSSLLNYPTLYRSRADVLAHLFLVLGNGYDWEADGTMSGSGPTDGKIDMSDLDEVSPAVMAHLGRANGMDGRAKECLTKLEREREDEQLAERARRKHVEANVKEMASTPDPEAVFYRKGHYEEGKQVVHYFDSGYCLGEMPDPVERSFKEGALEVLDIVIRDETDVAILAELHRIRAIIEAKKEI